MCKELKDLKFNLTGKRNSIIHQLHDIWHLKRKRQGKIVEDCRIIDVRVMVIHV